MRFPVFIAVLAAALALSCRVARSEPETLTLVHPGLPGSLYEISANEFARRLQEKLPATHSIAVLANPVMGDGLGLLDSLKNGRASFVLASSALLSVSDRFAIFELPFLIRSRPQFGAVRKELLGVYLQPEAEQKGLHILGVWESGFRQLTNDIRAVRSPKDMRELKIAILPANRWRERMLRAFGAEPLVMAARALPDALDTHVADGQEAPLNEISAMKLTATQRHLALSDHLYTPAFLVMNKAQLEALPAHLREVIMLEAAAMETWAEKRAIAMESDLIDRLDRRMEMTHIERDAFKAMAGPLYGAFIREVRQGSRMIQMLQDAEAASSAERAPR